MSENHVNNFPKLHNAAWPGVVGKGPDAEEPAIDLDTMLDLTAATEVDGVRFDGIDLFLFDPHVNVDASDDELKALADKISSRGLSIGTVVAPVWPGTVGDSAMGDDKAQEKFLTAIRKACRIAQVFNEHGTREYGVIRVDSAEFGVDKWREDPAAGTARIVDTFQKAAHIAADHGERLAAEGEICWAGMHSWNTMHNLLEEVGMPETLGFQADLAHSYTFMLGYNAPEDALLGKDHTDEDFWNAYEKMTDKLRPWTVDFHVVQNDGEVHGAGDHDKTGKHCTADDPNGKLDITKCAGYWLRDANHRGLQHICWDGCMFANDVMMKPQTWNDILAAMIDVRDAHGWQA